jgi:hypothetical protein
MTEGTCDVCIAPVYITGVGIKLCKVHFDELWAFKRAVEEQETVAQGGPWPTRCPRRDDMFQPQGEGATPDQWHITHDYRDTILKTCSFCGSLHPDDFMDRVRSGVEVGPTDKNYKAYIGGSGGPKFYYQHLSADQRREFVELLNDGTMRVGYPGHFYRLPFFCVPA